MMNHAIPGFENWTITQILNVQGDDPYFSKSVVVELYLHRKYPACEWHVGSYSYVNGFGVFSFSGVNASENKNREISESLALSVYERVQMFSISRDGQNSTRKYADLIDDDTWKSIVDGIINLVQVQLVLSE